MDINHDELNSCAYCGMALQQCVCTEEDIWWNKFNARQTRILDNNEVGNCWACGKHVTKCICFKNSHVYHSPEFDLFDKDED